MNARITITIIACLFSAAYLACVFKPWDPGSSGPEWFKTTVNWMVNWMKTTFNASDPYAQFAIVLSVLIGGIMLPAGLVGGMGCCIPLRLGLIVSMLLTSGVLIWTIVSWVVNWTDVMAVCFLATGYALAYFFGWALQYGLLVLWHRWHGTMPPKAQF